MKHYKEVDDLIKEIEARELRIAKAKRDGHWYEVVSAFMSLSFAWLFFAALYVVSGAWRDDA